MADGKTRPQAEDGEEHGHTDAGADPCFCGGAEMCMVAVMVFISLFVIGAGETEGKNSVRNFMSASEGRTKLRKISGRVD